MDVTLVDVMGDESSIVQAARVSYGDGTKTAREDTALIRYLMRHWHTTPFEMVEFKFLVKCPIFVARQMMRHRTASINEYSARYSVVKDEFWIPDHFRTQSTVNHQGSDEPFDDPELMSDYIAACDHAMSTYKRMLDRGVARELARCVLPQCVYTEFYWKINLHNLLHFLRLRMDSHAQPEIQTIATKIWDYVKVRLPNVARAFIEFRVDAITFTGPEIRGDNLSRGEQREYDEKSAKFCR